MVKAVVKTKSGMRLLNKFYLTCRVKGSEFQLIITRGRRAKCYLIREMTTLLTGYKAKETLIEQNLWINIGIDEWSDDEDALELYSH